MVTQPSIAQGIKFNIQHLDLYPEPGNNRGSGYSTSWIYQNAKVMRQ